jgi:radical SAM protein with 4Fe4S-binding SPASM domain
MTMGLYSKILSDLLPMGRIRSLKLYMVGEPFLNPHLVEMVEAARMLDIAERIEITTNGSLVSGDVVDPLLHSGLDYLRFSIYATGETQITRNVRNVVKRRNELGLAKPYICVKYIGRTQKEIDKFLQTYEGVGDEQIVEPLGNWGDTIVLAEASKKEVCPFIFYMLGIKANGDVLPCCIDWKASMKLGNVKEQSIKEIWDGAPRARIVEAHLERNRRNLPVCISCTLPKTTPDDLESLTLDEYERRSAVKLADEVFGI